MTAFVETAESQIKTLTKQRTILNVQKKKHQPLFQALTDEEVLAPANGSMIRDTAVWRRRHSNIWMR